MKVINEDKTLEIIRENAVNTSQKFSIDNMVQAYIKIIEGEKLKVFDFNVLAYHLIIVIFAIDMYDKHALIKILYNKNI